MSAVYAWVVSSATQNLPWDNAQLAPRPHAFVCFSLGTSPCLELVPNSGSTQSGPSSFSSYCALQLRPLALSPRRHIQDFVHLVIRTGAHLEMRWNELSVQSLIQHVGVGWG